MTDQAALRASAQNVIDALAAVEADLSAYSAAFKLALEYVHQVVVPLAQKILDGSPDPDALSKLGNITRATDGALEECAALDDAIYAFKGLLDGKNG